MSGARVVDGTGVANVATGVPVLDHLLTELARAMTDASICGLGQAAGNPLKCLLKYFPEELA